MSDIETRDNTEQSRYEAWLDGRLAGFAEYDLQGQDTIVFTHTEVGDEFEGRGVGSALARGALDDVRGAGQRQVVAQCSFIRGWIEKHPEYADLTRG